MTLRELEDLLERYIWWPDGMDVGKTRQILITHGIDLDRVNVAIAKLVREEVARAMEKKKP